MDLPIDIDRAALAALCEKYGIEQLELFGSVLREDFGPDSDVDVLVRFREGESPGLDEYLDIQEGLEALFGRAVDVLNRRVIEGSKNPYRKRSILESARVLFAA
ncbi:MAG: nucleotidyltransferase domain-containing protein [Chrysiogenetes bacterium]|nr:nucleotidyltransferase domain-containing protein [Chrysiogenetes bacterium]